MKTILYNVYTKNADGKVTKTKRYARMSQYHRRALYANADQTSGQTIYWNTNNEGVAAAKGCF